MGESSHIDPLGRSTQEECTLLYRTYVAAYALFILALFNLKYDDSLHIAYCETSIVWKVSRYKLNQQTQVVRRITSCISLRGRRAYQHILSYIIVIRCSG